MFDRQYFANAIVAFAQDNADMRARLERTCEKHDDCKACPALARACSSSRVLRLSDKRLDRWHNDTQLDAVLELEPEERLIYLLLVQKYDGPADAEELADQLARVEDPGGVVVHVSNSEDDPYMLTFSINDPIASAWADRHGSLDGGTWESCDGPEFTYDHGIWHAKLFQELEKEGYVFDYSELYEPDENDHAIAEHWHDCAACQYQGEWRDAKAHYESGGKAVPREQTTLFPAREVHG